MFKSSYPYVHGSLNRVLELSILKTVAKYYYIVVLDYIR